jgi:hypothetical protein
MQIVLENIEKEVKRLSKEELRKVKDLVDSLLEERETKPPMTEEEFEQKLYEEGFIGKPPPPIEDFSRYEDFEPVKVKGKPVSETIIEERR